MDAVAGFFMGILALIVPGLAPQTEYYGYIEADYMYIAPEGAGRVTALNVNEGDHVGLGDVLFTLDDTAQRASSRAAEARRAVAEANLQDMQTGSRSAEVDVIKANLHKAEADLSLALLTFERDQKLLEKGFVSEAQLDGDKANLATAEAQVAQLRAQLEVAALPARDAQLTGAEQSLQAAEADIDLAQSNLNARAIVAPANALVERVYFRAGEVVGVGVPVMSLLPPGTLKARFFVPEAVRANLNIGDEMVVTCDGCTNEIAAVMVYMASDPQHTPPIIYSREERARLVFMAEARLSPDVRLLPGQPISISVAK